MPTLAEHRAKQGNFLYRFAWVIEVGAATVGLALAWLFFEKTRNAIEVSYVDITLATLPFVAVAAVELTKIPLVTVFYLSQSRTHTYLFFFALLFVSFITFETFFTGMQAASIYRLRPIEQLQRDLDLKEGQLENLQRSKLNLVGLEKDNIETTYTNTIAAIKNREESKIQSAKEERDDTLRQSPVVEKEEELEQELKDIREKETQLSNSYDASEKEISKLFKDEEKSLSMHADRERKALRERVNSLTKEKQSIEEQIVAFQNELATLRKQSIDSITATRELDIKEKYKARRKAAEKQVNDKRQDFIKYKTEKQAELDVLREKVEGADIFTFIAAWEERIKKLEGEIHDLSVEIQNLNVQDRIDKLYRQEKIDISTMRGKAEREHRARIDILEKKTPPLEQRRQEKEKTIEEIEKKFSADLQHQQRRNLVEERNNDLEKLREEKQSALGELKTKEENIKQKLDRVRQDRAQIKYESTADYSAKQQRIKERSAQEQKEAERLKIADRDDFAHREERLGQTEKKISELRGEIVEGQNKLMESGQENLISRFAIMFFGDLKPFLIGKFSISPLSVVSTIWFGSLAAIVAFTGSILAFGSCVLRFERDVQEEKKTKSKLSLAIRRWFVDRRKRARKPKIQIQEKMVEVEKEVIRNVVEKEYVHVPLYTNDLDLLKLGKEKSEQDQNDGENKNKNDTEGNIN